MLSRYRHISFDLDGTLVHTAAAYRQMIVPRVVAALGGSGALSQEIIDRFWFDHDRDHTIRRHFLLDPELFWPVYNSAEQPAERSLHTFVYEDAARAIARLKGMGKTISIITGSPHYVAAMEIAKLGEAKHDYYCSITSRKLGHKPNPAGLHLAMQELRATPAETVYIGNAAEDAQFAKNAGVDFIHLDRKEYRFDIRGLALATIHSLDELFDGAAKTTSLPQGEAQPAHI